MALPQDPSTDTDGWTPQLFRNCYKVALFGHVLFGPAPGFQSTAPAHPTSAGKGKGAVSYAP